MEQKVDEIMLSRRMSLDIAKILLENVFIGWTCETNVQTKFETIQHKDVRKYLILDFYHILCDNQNKYFIELNDYTKNSEYHDMVKQKIKNIAILGDNLKHKSFHDEIIYYMMILS
jgi:hypothetical protein